MRVSFTADPGGWFLGLCLLLLCLLQAQGARLTQHEPGRVALNFVGLTRSLSITHPTIVRRLIQPITDAGYQVDIFLHTYDLEEVDNAWAGEHTKLNTSEWQLLSPLKVSITSQQAFLSANRERIGECEAYGHGWEHLAHAKFDIARNMLCQLNSIAEVTKLWQAQHGKTPYDFVIYARPDVNYNCPFPVKYMQEVKANTIAIPDHSHYLGMNDRFAVMPPEVASKYGDRLEYTLKRCTSDPIHAESYMKKWVIDNGIDVVMMEKFDFFRLRSNGMVAVPDAAALKGCNLREMHQFPVQKSMARQVRIIRQQRFHDLHPWGSLADRDKRPSNNLFTRKDWESETGHRSANNSYR